MDRTKEAARVLMHLIQTGRKAQWKQDDHLEHPEGWPYFYGKTPDDTEMQEFEAADIIDRLAGGPGVQDGFVSEWWSDDFGSTLTRVRTANGIIAKAKAHAKK